MPSSPTPSRRAVLAGLGAAAAVTASGTALPGRVGAQTAPTATEAPFLLGVASGDPWPDGFVLWTRLATNPLAADGLGGMPATPIPVDWQVATDPACTKIVQQGTVQARPEQAHSVHVTTTGLPAGREFFYRFRAMGKLSPIGRTLTAPAPGAMPPSLRLAVATCAQYEHGWFTAYRAIANDRPDLVLHIGDYHYEHSDGFYPVGSGQVRHHPLWFTYTLAQYRHRMALYKTDPDLQAAHAAAPWLAVFDDHEVANNWAGHTPEVWDPNFMERRRVAFQSYYENMPLRDSAVPTGYDMQLFRRFAWGQLANLHMLDTRQYRDDQANGDLVKVVDAAPRDPNRSITGARQEQWLIDGFRQSRARWDLLGNQVFFAQDDHTSGPLQWGNMDAWDGYVASRDRITAGFVNAKVRNPVIFTGDVHSAWANELKVNYDDPAAPSVGVEFVSSSITTEGDGSDASSGHLAYNPHIKFSNGHRGYLRATVTPTQLTTEFRAVAKVSVPGDQPFTRATFTVADGDRTLHPA